MSVRRRKYDVKVGNARRFHMVFVLLNVLHLNLSNTSRQKRQIGSLDLGELLEIIRGFLKYSNLHS